MNSHPHDNTMGTSNTLSTVFFSLIAVVFLLSSVVEARQMRKSELRARQLEAAKRWSGPLVERAKSSGGVQNITFSNPKASRMSKWSRKYLLWLIKIQEFFVDGTSIPEVDFDAGPSWAGLLPISGNSNETRKVMSFIKCSEILILHHHSSSFGFSRLGLQEASMTWFSGLMADPDAHHSRVCCRRMV